MTSTPAPRVLIVDDHPVFRAGLASLLAKLPEAPTVSEACSLSEAWAAIERQTPDCVTVDLHLGDGNGFTLLSKARQRGLPSRFVIITTFDDPNLRRRAHTLGADGFAAKESDPYEVAGLVQCVLAAPVRPRGLTSNEPVPDLEVHTPMLGALSRLTGSEQRVMRLLSRNQTSTEIAAALGVSTRTVQNHRAHICEKLGLRGAHRLLEVALELRDVLGDR